MKKHSDGQNRLDRQSWRGDKDSKERNNWRNGNRSTKDSRNSWTKQKMADPKLQNLSRPQFVNTILTSIREKFQGKNIIKTEVEGENILLVVVNNTDQLNRIEACLVDVVFQGFGLSSMSLPEAVNTNKDKNPAKGFLCFLKFDDENQIDQAKKCFPNFKVKKLDKKSDAEFVPGKEGVKGLRTPRSPRSYSTTLPEVKNPYQNKRKGKRRNSLDWTKRKESPQEAQGDEIPTPSPHKPFAEDETEPEIAYTTDN